MKSLTHITIDYDDGNSEIFGLRRPFSSWVRKDENLRVPDDGKQYVQVLDDTAVLGAPRQYKEEGGLIDDYPFPAVVNAKWGITPLVPAFIQERWQRWLYEFHDWQTGYMLPRGEHIGTHVNKKNPAIVYDDYTPGSLLDLYSQMIMDAKFLTESGSPETGAKDYVTGRNLSNPKEYQLMLTMTCGALLQVTSYGSYWKAKAINLSESCPLVDTLPPYLYYWCTQVHIDGRLTRFPDVKNALEVYGLSPAGTAMPLFSLDGSFLIKKSACKPLTNGQVWSPYKN